jgi:hypothetical protein
MTLYTQALTYAINNIDNLCYFFETEIEKQLEKKTHLTDCTYFVLALSLENNRFVPHVIESGDTEYQSAFNYNQIILIEDYLKNIKDDPDYAWQLKESFLDSLDEIKEYDQQANQTDTDQKGIIITPETTDNINTILKKLGQNPNDIAEKYAKVDYETNKNVPSLQSLITYYQLIFDQPASIFARTHSLKTLNDLLPELIISYKGDY